MYRRDSVGLPPVLRGRADHPHSGLESNALRAHFTHLLDLAEAEPASAFTIR